MWIEDKLAKALQSKDKARPKKGCPDSKRLEARIEKEIEARRAYAERTKNWNHGTYAAAA